MLVILIDLLWYLPMVIICIFVMSNDIFGLFICLFAILHYLVPWRYASLEKRDHEVDFEIENGFLIVMLELYIG